MTPAAATEASSKPPPPGPRRPRPRTDHRRSWPTAWLPAAPPAPPSSPQARRRSATGTSRRDQTAPREMRPMPSPTAGERARAPSAAKAARLRASPRWHSSTSPCASSARASSPPAARAWTTRRHVRCRRTSPSGPSARHATRRSPVPTAGAAASGHLKRQVAAAVPRRLSPHRCGASQHLPRPWPSAPARQHAAPGAPPASRQSSRRTNPTVPSWHRLARPAPRWRRRQRPRGAVPPVAEASPRPRVRLQLAARLRTLALSWP